jgi:multiple sugar transport system permease protein
MTSIDTTRPAPQASRWISLAVTALLLVVLLVFFVLPVIWLLLAPTKTAADLVNEWPLAFGSLHNVGRAWQNLTSFQDGILFVWLKNSAIYSVGSLVLTLATSVPAGYALALTKFRGRRLLLSITLLVMIMPSAALVLPLFLELNRFGLIGTAWSIILPFSFFPFGVYLTYIYFSTSVSRDLLDAARIDGASEFSVFSRIAIPLATPVIALVGFFNLVGNWNNYFLPFVMEPGRKAPIQVGLAELLSNVPLFNPTSAGSITIDLPVVALATLLSVAPVLIIFLFSQRFLVEGMTAGGTKE